VIDSRVNLKLHMVCRHLGAFVARRQVFNPLALCRVASTTVCMGCVDYLPSWRCPLCEDNIEMIKQLGAYLSKQAFVVSQGVPWERLSD
jgi:hypothetical protein